MLKTRTLITVLFFCLSLRTFVGALILELDTPIADYQALVSGSLMFFALSTICLALIKKYGEKILTVAEIKSSLFTFWNGFLIAVVLIGFTLGQHAVEVLVVSNIDIGTAFKLWNFPQRPPDPPDFTSPALSLKFIVAIILAPFSEELFFRRLLIGSLLQRYNKRISIFISSLIFSALHFQSFHFISTMVFAITLALLYLKSGSIFICMAVHSIFNIFAVINDLYGFSPIVTEQNIIDPATWLPSLTIYALSVAALALLAARFQRLYGTSWSPYSAKRVRHENANP